MTDCACNVFPAALGRVSILSPEGLAVAAGSLEIAGNATVTGSIRAEYGSLSVQSNIESRGGGLFIAGGSTLLGNVGIGTGAPQRALHVAGDARVGGELESVQLRTLGNHAITGSVVSSHGSLVLDRGGISAPQGSLALGGDLSLVGGATLQYGSVVLHAGGLAALGPAGNVHAGGGLYVDKGTVLKGNVAIGASTSPDRALVVHGDAHVRGTLTGDALNTPGDHFRVVGQGGPETGRVEATALTIRPDPATPNQTVFTVDGAGNLTKVGNMTASGAVTTTGLLKGGTVESTGEVRAGGRRIADGQGCYYA